METKDPYLTNSPTLLTHGQIITKAQPLRCTFPGIYFLIRDHHVVYVGQSISNILVRIAAHTRDKEFDSYAVIPVDDPSIDLNTLEAAYIYQLEPHYNGYLPHNDRFLSKAKLKDATGMTAWQINRVVRNKKLRPHLGSYYDLRDFQEQEQ